MRFSRSISTCAILAAAFLTVTASLPVQSFAGPLESGWETTVQRTPSTNQVKKKESQTVRPFALHLGFSDERAALEALQFALNEVGDGATFIWHRKSGLISGTVRPTAAFVDEKHRICRHVIFSLSAGDQTRSIEGIACRGPKGAWQL